MLHTNTPRPPVGAPASGPAKRISEWMSQAMPAAIPRDAAGLAKTAYCREEPDGGLTITAGHVLYELAPERIADGPAFGETWFALQDKTWFTPEVALDLASVVLARWYARACGWVS